MTFAYLATPYTKFPAGPEAAFKMACRLAADLLAFGVPVFCPIAHSHPIAEHGRVDPFDHDLWMRADAPFMAAAGALIVYEADGWQESRGMAEEIRSFQEVGKPIFHIKSGRPVMVPAEVFEWLSSMRA